MVKINKKLWVTGFFIFGVSNSFPCLSHYNIQSSNESKEWTVTCKRLQIPKPKKSDVSGLSCFSDNGEKYGGRPGHLIIGNMKYTCSKVYLGTPHWGYGETAASGVHCFNK